MIKRNTKLNPNSFIRKVLAQRRTINLAVSHIQKLEEQWIRKYCPVIVGQEVPIDSPDGYTMFEIEKIHVDITEAGKEYTISFSATGMMKAEGKESKKARLKFNSPDVKDETKEIQSGAVNG